MGRLIRRVLCLSVAIIYLGLTLLRVSSDLPDDEASSFTVIYLILLQARFT